MPFAIGSLVKARGREWVVLPESAETILKVRPLGGTEDEETGINLHLETVTPATFALPDPQQTGDFRSCRLLRDAVRLGFRSSAGPFRSFGRIAVEPRPYQLVPLMMALKQDIVRMLIADDVGIGKSVEAGLIARELLDRGEIQRIAVLCPPHLAEQWQTELSEKFHIQAELVLASTAKRLERNCGTGESLFDIHPFVIVSTDFIKSDNRRMEFLRSCPEFVIVDEAHTCAYGFGGRGGHHQRYELVKGLAGDKDRHMVLVTATPHCGNDAAFRSLLEILNPAFAQLPEDLTGRHNEKTREQLAQFIIQRMRADVKAYMDRTTVFPERQEAEQTYELSAEYKKFLDKVLEYARETVKDPDSNQYHQRVRWWAALALLRSISSSPAAAAATLRNRCASADTETPEEADEIGSRSVLDLDPDEALEGVDLSAGSDIGDKAKDVDKNRRRLLDLAREADSLKGEKDAKLKKAAKIVEDFVKNGFNPILFCRFIDTAEYVAAELRSRIKLKDVEIVAVTGILPHAEREERIKKMDAHAKRVLVCTDCLSEGINLQDSFDAVIHYDLAWNPTRHDQRAGRVDRYGQPKSQVRVLTYYGSNNPMDGIILEVLLRKHKAIKSKLGISVSLPVDTKQVMQALMQGLLLRGKQHDTPYLDFMYDGYEGEKNALHTQWDAAAEKRSRTVFAQQSIKPDEVHQELESVRAAIGCGVDVERFTRDAVLAYKGVAAAKSNGLLHLNLRETPRALKESLQSAEEVDAKFELPVEKPVIYLSRTHPLVEGLASYVMETSLDAQQDSLAKRCGVTRTGKVSTRTTLLLVRYRFHIVVKKAEGEQPLLAEDCQLLGFTGSPEKATWLDSSAAEDLWANAQPEGNVSPDMARQFLNAVIQGYPALRPQLNDVARLRGKEILAAHTRVRSAAKARGLKYEVEPKLPADVLGVFVFLPK